MKGIGVLINTLGGNEETIYSLKSAIGRIIKSLKIEDDCLIFKFTDNCSLEIWDNGQSCCESRYMTTDDDLSEFEGSSIYDFELKESGNIESEYEEHEIQFLDIKTSNGVFTITTHNEHNGYCGGFYISAIFKGNA